MVGTAYARITLEDDGVRRTFRYIFIESRRFGPIEKETQGCEQEADHRDVRNVDFDLRSVRRKTFEPKQGELRQPDGQMADSQNIQDHNH